MQGSFGRIDIRLRKAEVSDDMSPNVRLPCAPMWPLVKVKSE